MEIDLTQACVGELNTILRGESNWPIIYGVGVNIKTGEIFPASFPDKGPDLPLRQARNFTGGQTVSCFTVSTFYSFNDIEQLFTWQMTNLHILCVCVCFFFLFVSLSFVPFDLEHSYPIWGKIQVLDIYDSAAGMLRIGPFNYDPIRGVDLWLAQSDEFLLTHLSTSPEVEPPHFTNQVHL